MNETELIKKAQTGDQIAFLKLIESYIVDIEKLVLQYGVSIEGLDDFMRRSVNEIKENISEFNVEENLKLWIYKMTIEKLIEESGFQVSNVDFSLFHFKEDNELYVLIASLEVRKKVPFILSQFHQFSVAEIAEIMSTPLAEVTNNIEEAHIHLMNKLNISEKESADLFDKRILFLAKSWNRVPSKVKIQNLLIENKIDNSNIEKELQSNSKMRLKPFWIVGFVLLFAIVIGAVQTLGNSKEDDPYVKELKETYQKERENKRALLVMEDERFSNISFVKHADEIMTNITNEDQDSLQDVYEKAIELLKLPSEMVDELKMTPLTEDEKKSIEFLQDYRQKVLSLVDLYNEILNDYPEIYENNKVDGKLSFDLLRITNDDDPDEYKSLLNTMNEQNIGLRVNEQLNTAFFHFADMNGELYDKLHVNTHGYFLLMTSEKFMDNGKFLYSPQDLAYFVLSMQETLLKVEKDEILYPTMEQHFTNIFHALVKGLPNYEIETENGVVKVEIQQAWDTLAAVRLELPTAYLMVPIIEEMEKSNWKHSKSRDLFNPNQIMNAMTMAKNGELSQFVPDIGYENRTVQFPNTEYDQSVKALYEKFVSSEYDLNVIKGAHPIDVIGLLEYANQMENPNVIFHLIINDEMGPISVKEYAENWTKRVSLLNDIESISYSSKDMTRYGKGSYYGYLSMTKDKQESMYFHLNLSEDDIWRFSIYNWPQDLTQFNEAETKIDTDFMQRVRELYKLFSESKDQSVLENAKASEIVGLYFYSGELGDAETQYQLHYNNYDYFVDKEQHEIYFVETFRERMKFKDFYESIIFIADNKVNDMYYPSGTANLSFQNPKYPEETVIHEFKLRKGDFGWRVLFRPLE